MKLTSKTFAIYLSLLSLVCTQTYAIRLFYTWENLLESSDYIVWAEVSDVEKLGDGERITTFSIIRIYKGNPPDTISINWNSGQGESKLILVDVQPDGCKNVTGSTTTTWVEDQIQSLGAVSDQYLLFLKRQPDGSAFFDERFMKKKADGLIPYMCFFHIKDLPCSITDKAIKKTVSYSDSNGEQQHYKWIDIKDWLEGNYTARDGYILPEGEPQSLQEKENHKAEEMPDIEVDVESILKLRQKKLIDYSLTLDEGMKKTIQEIIHEIDRIAASDLPQEERETNVHKESVKLLKLPYPKQGLVALYLLELVPTVESEEARNRCISRVIYDGDERCVEPLKTLLDLEDISLSEKNRYDAYKAVSNLGGQNQVEYLRCEYSAEKSYWERCALATELALYGDATGARTLVEMMEKNEDEDTREFMRQFLSSLYGVDHGTDTEAWNNVCRNGMPLNGEMNKIPSN